MFEDETKAEADQARRRALREADRLSLSTRDASAEQRIKNAPTKAELLRLQQQQHEIRRTYWGVRYDYAIRAALSAKYRPDQPRVPAGSPEGGQWTSDAGAQSTDISSASRPKGGFRAELMKLTVRQFVSRYCRGQINRELPAEFNDVTLSDLMELAKGGDAAAKKCYKILNQGRFRK